MTVVEIFDAAVEVPEAEREAFLQRACGGDETLLRKVNAADFAGAAAQFELWVHAGGEVVAGLVRRRKMEAEMFLSHSVMAN